MVAKGKSRVLITSMCLVFGSPWAPYQESLYLLMHFFTPTCSEVACLERSSNNMFVRSQVRAEVTLPLVDRAKQNLNISLSFHSYIFIYYKRHHIVEFDEVII